MSILSQKPTIIIYIC